MNTNGRRFIHDTGIAAIATELAQTLEGMRILAMQPLTLWMCDKLTYVSYTTLYGDRVRLPEHAIRYRLSPLKRQDLSRFAFYTDDKHIISFSKTQLFNMSAKPESVYAYGIVAPIDRTAPPEYCFSSQDATQKSLSASEIGPQRLSTGHVDLSRILTSWRSLSAPESMLRTPELFIGDYFDMDEMDELFAVNG